MKFDINAVIVTCNRCDLLKLSINALLNQTYPLNRIVVINNASTDGTKEYLDAINDEKVIVIHKEINEGGAGGFYYGVKEAYEIGCDFVWIMDDDTICANDSLEKLLSSYELVEDRNIGFLASDVLYKDGRPCFMNICRPDYVWGEYAEHGIVRVTHCSFVAMLIPCSVIKRVGLPIKEYFIWGDDGEYSTRILAEYEGYVCSKSKVYHYMNANIGVDIWNVEKDRINRFFYFYRNWMCTHMMRSKLAAKQFEKETKKLISDIRHSNTSYKKEKIEIIKKGIKAGKKFKVSIKYPNELDVYKKDTDINPWQHGVLRIVRHFLIKYDIKTQGSVTHCKNLYRKYIKIQHSPQKKVGFLLDGFFKTKLYNSGDKVVDLEKLLSETHISFCKSKYFAYTVDVYKTWKIKSRQMANCTIDYDLLLNNSIKDLKLTKGIDKFYKDNNAIMSIVESYAHRIAKEVRRSKLKNKIDISLWLDNIGEKEAESIEEALQRILFLNQIMWQTNHIQMGLGRIDKLLEKYLTDDMTDDYLDDLFTDFIKILHNYYWLKSEEMPGDTGQIIILGGRDTDKKIVCNRITYSIIRVIKKCQLPDPKVLLRVTNDTPDDLWKLAIECIATGIGCPLISNDEVIIDKLMQFGYEKSDAVNYVTSACWELIPENSCEQNNIGVFDWSMPFELLGKKDDLSELDTWEKFIWRFSEHLCGHVAFMTRLTDYIEWEKDPLLSAFNNSCRRKRLDISAGGGKYNNYGILSVGLSNAINSLVNIRKFVYKDQCFTLKELYRMRNKNYVGEDEVFSLLKNSDKYWGTDEDKEDVIGLTNWLIMRVNDKLKDIRNKYDGKIKFGLSSPGFIIMGKNNAATFDGRKDGEPYGIHISADYNSSITSLFNFASKLNYGEHGFNGNVVDFTMQPNFIINNIDKFVALMKSSIRAGVFQLQMNVLNSKTLIEAKNNPEKFPNLIVRVWGFSAYFRDLPNEYKEYVIERAIKNEAVNY